MAKKAKKKAKAPAPAPAPACDFCPGDCVDTVIRCSTCPDTYCSAFCAKTMGMEAKSGNMCHYCQKVTGALSESEYRQRVEEKTRVYYAKGYSGPSADEIATFMALLQLAAARPDLVARAGSTHN